MNLGGAFLFLEFTPGSGLAAAFFLPNHLLILLATFCFEGKGFAPFRVGLSRGPKRKAITTFLAHKLGRSWIVASEDMAERSCCLVDFSRTPFEAERVRDEEAYLYLTAPAPSAPS